MRSCVPAELRLPWAIQGRRLTDTKSRGASLSSCTMTFGRWAPGPSHGRSLATLQPWRRAASEECSWVAACQRQKLIAKLVEMCENIFKWRKVKDKKRYAPLWLAARPPRLGKGWKAISKETLYWVPKWLGLQALIRCSAPVHRPRARAPGSCASLVLTGRGHAGQISPAAPHRAWVKS